MRLFYKLACRLNVHVLMPLKWMLVFKQYLRPDGSYTPLRPRLERMRPCPCGCDSYLYRKA